VHEHARWCLVDVLADGHQGDPGLGEREVDGDVVGAGPGEPVEDLFSVPSRSAPLLVR